MTHRAKLLLLALIATLSTSLLMAIPIPQEHPPRPGQPEYCTVAHKDTQYVCTCINHDMGAGCKVKDGRRGRQSEEGMSGVCLSHCRISHCHCCLS